VLPGHGPELPSAGRVAEFYLQHRAERLAQVAKAVADGARTAREVVEIVYVDVDQVLWPAAELSVHAQLDYLVEQTPSLADQVDRTPTPDNELAARMAEATRVRVARPAG
jgi:hypothetical protein